MNIQHWSEGLAQCRREQIDYTLVTVIGGQGSTPREPGAKMLVTANETYDSIGGGQFEFLAIQHARELLLQRASRQDVVAYPLGAAAAQCCGGHVSLLFEAFVAQAQPVIIFGAGHVAQALLPLLAQLPCRVHWLDSRAELFPPIVPANVVTAAPENIAAMIDTLPQQAYVVVLTHNHALDYELVSNYLRRDDFAFLGMIGSATKSLRFRQRLQRDGIDSAHIEKLHCPIGLREVPGKLPIEVAVSIAGQLIAFLHGEGYRDQDCKSTQSKRRGIDWRELKQALATAEARVVAE